MITYFHDSDDIGNGVFSERLYAAADVSSRGFVIELIRTRGGQVFEAGDLSSKDRAAFEEFFSLWVSDFNRWRFA
jgi:hypothetical protein